MHTSYWDVGQFMLLLWHHNSQSTDCSYSDNTHSAYLSLELTITVSVSWRAEDTVGIETKVSAVCIIFQLLHCLVLLIKSFLYTWSLKVFPTTLQNKYMSKSILYQLIKAVLSSHF